METDSRFTNDLAALETLQSRLGGDFGRHELVQLSTAARALAQLAEAGQSEQHIARTTLAAQRFQESLKRARESLSERERGGLQALAQARKERLRLETDKAYLPIATAFQNADSQSRLQWLKEATEAGDGRVLAALLETPHYVHGIAPDVLSKFLDAAEARHAPDLHEKRQQFNSDREVVQAALRVGEAVASRAVDLESIAAAEAADKAEGELQKATA